jgi:hypothetical protein
MSKIFTSKSKDRDFKQGGKLPKLTSSVSRVITRDYYGIKIKILLTCIRLVGIYSLWDEHTNKNK